MRPPESTKATTDSSCEYNTEMIERQKAISHHTRSSRHIQPNCAHLCLGQLRAQLQQCFRKVGGILIGRRRDPCAARPEFRERCVRHRIEITGQQVGVAKRAAFGVGELLFAKGKPPVCAAVHENATHSWRGVWGSIWRLLIFLMHRSFSRLHTIIPQADREIFVNADGPV